MEQIQSVDTTAASGSRTAWFKWLLAGLVVLLNPEHRQGIDDQW